MQHHDDSNLFDIGDLVLIGTHLYIIVFTQLDSNEFDDQWQNLKLFCVKTQKIYDYLSFKVIVKLTKFNEAY